MKCSYCKAELKHNPSRINRAVRSGLPLFCNRACFGLVHRLNNPPTLAEKKEAKRIYDQKYRLLDPEAMRAKKAKYYAENHDREKERIQRKARMPYHVAYCRQPEYVAKKREFDKQQRINKYADYGEAWRILLDLEKEIRSRATKYERLVAKGYFNRSSIQRRREAWRKLKHSQQSI